MCAQKALCYRKLAHSLYPSITSTYHDASSLHFNPSASALASRSAFRALCDCTIYLFSFGFKNFRPGLTFFSGVCELRVFAEVDGGGGGAASVEEKEEEENDDDDEETVAYKLPLLTSLLAAEEC